MARSLQYRLLACLWAVKPACSLWHGTSLDPVPEALAHLAGFARRCQAYQGCRNHTAEVHIRLVDQQMDPGPRRVTNLPAPLDALEITSDPGPRQPLACLIVTAVQHIVVLGHHGIESDLYMRAILVLRQHAHLVNVWEELREVRVVHEDRPDAFPRRCHCKRGPQAAEPLRMLHRFDNHLTRQEPVPIHAAYDRGAREEECPDQQEPSVPPSPGPSHA